MSDIPHVFVFNHLSLCLMYLYRLYNTNGKLKKKNRTVQGVRQSSVCPTGSSRRMTLPSLDAARRSQRPYRYGMILLCVGALINWLGLAENYVEPVRYIGVACIIAGALLICAAMCCWLQRPASDHPDNISQVKATILTLLTIICCSVDVTLTSAER
jgi:hypothetical protein